MQIYGYHRTSTKEQHLDRGIQEIDRKTFYEKYPELSNSAN